MRPGNGYLRYVFPLSECAFLLSASQISSSSYFSEGASSVPAWTQRLQNNGSGLIDSTCKEEMQPLQADFN